MKYTMDNLMNAINMALNYPALRYDDIALFFDQAVAEINTTLHTGLRSFHDWMETAKSKVDGIMRNAYVFESRPTSDMRITVCSESAASDLEYYYDSDKKQYGRKVNGTFEYSDNLYGVFNDVSDMTLYEAYKFSDDTIVWVTSKGVCDWDVTEVLPEDWILLFLIPYVCFKYTVRDGGVANTFAEELEQGFQQLQESYDVPEYVNLGTVAGLSAYTEDVKDHLPNITNVVVPTRAIYESMRHSRAVNGTYGGIFDRNGFAEDDPWGGWL